MEGKSKILINLSKKSLSFYRFMLYRPSSSDCIGHLFFYAVNFHKTTETIRAPLQTGHRLFHYDRG